MSLSLRHRKLQCGFGFHLLGAIINLKVFCKLENALKMSFEGILGYRQGGCLNFILEMRKMEAHRNYCDRSMNCSRKKHTP